MIVTGRAAVAMKKKMRMIMRTLVMDMTRTKKMMTTAITVEGLVQAVHPVEEEVMAPAVIQEEVIMVQADIPVAEVLAPVDIPVVVTMVADTGPPVPEVAVTAQMKETMVVEIPTGTVALVAMADVTAREIATVLVQDYPAKVSVETVDKAVTVEVVVQAAVAIMVLVEESRAEWEVMDFPKAIMVVEEMQAVAMEE